jgi:hypothetical protein
MTAITNGGFFIVFLALSGVPNECSLRPTVEAWFH